MELVLQHLIRQAFGGDAILVDYPGQMEALNQVVSR